jgi:hypothetical protein
VELIAASEADLRRGSKSFLDGVGSCLLATPATPRCIGSDAPFGRAAQARVSVQDFSFRPQSRTQIPKVQPAPVAPSLRRQAAAPLLPSIRPPFPWVQIAKSGAGSSIAALWHQLFAPETTLPALSQTTTGRSFTLLVCVFVVYKCVHGPSARLLPGRRDLEPLPGGSCFIVPFRAAFESTWSDTHLFYFSIIDYTVRSQSQ